MMVLLSSLVEKIKAHPMRTLGILALIGCIAFIFFYVHRQNAEIESLKQQLSIAQQAPSNPPKVTVLDGSNDKPNAANISGAGGISSNMAKDFERQVNKTEARIDSGKATPLYNYTVVAPPAQVITDFNKSVKEGTAPKEVQKADFVTVNKDAPVQKETIAEDGSKQTMEETTVHINAYNNYKPSLYYATQVSNEDSLKRHELIYTNRDILLGVNFDNTRGGNKFGATIGYRIASW